MVIGEILEIEVPQALVEQMVSQEHLERLDQLGHQVQLAKQERGERMEREETQDQLDLLDQLDHLEVEGKMASQVHQASEDLPVPLDLLDLKVLVEVMELLESVEILEILVLLEHKGRKVHRDLGDNQEIKVTEGPLVQLAPLAHKVRKV
jgi:hypothetical protein